VCLDKNRISNNSYTKFLRLIVDHTLSWKPHIDHLINKLSTACYVIRSVKPYVNTNAIIMIHHSLFHAVMTYGIIFWGNSSHSTQVFRMQKKRQLGLLRGVVTEHIVETCLKNWTFYHWCRNIYSLYLHLCQIIGKSILQILKYTT
jgi:hypothetical protein